MNSACASDCASVVRPWVANDTGGVPMCIKSQDEYEFLHSWVVGPYWTGFQRQGFDDGMTSPTDWRTAVVHPHGSACSAGGNLWFDSLMSHQRARPLLEHCAAHPASHLCLRGCTATMEDHTVWSLNEPSKGDMPMGDNNGEQNCIFRERDDWRWWITMYEYGQTSMTSGWWCVEASTVTDPTKSARRRRLSIAPTLCATQEDWKVRVRAGMASQPRLPLRTSRCDTRSVRVRTAPLHLRASAPL